jgi:formate hydrogenlyase transcriptional activator
MRNAGELMPHELLDLTDDLRQVTSAVMEPAGVDQLINRALDSLSPMVPYDLAAVLELDGDLLRVRCARGPLADSRVRKHEIRLADFPSVQSAIETRSARVLLEHDHRGDEGDPYDGVLDLPHGHSCMVVPLFAADRTLGAMTFDRQVCGMYEPAVVKLAALCGQLLALAMAAADQAARLNRMRAELLEHNQTLRAEARAQDAGYILDQSRNAAMQQAIQMARSVAVTDTPVLLTGETGTGKEVLAEMVHDWSRRAGTFVKLNCAAIPEALVESELFGHTKGAFSGATTARAGRFVTANGGTLLLDEIGDMPLTAQAKLLRVLQDGTFEPVGSDRTVKVDVRVVAASNCDLAAAIARGRFRSDLFYRLNVFPLRLPPLRERREDIPLIAEEFLRGFARRTGGGPWSLSGATIERLQAYAWPGNIRELANLLERAAILSPPGTLEVDLPPGIGVEENAPAAKAWRSLAATEGEYIREVLAHTRGRIYGPDGAAKLLGLKPSTLQSRMQKLGIARGSS